MTPRTSSAAHDPEKCKMTYVSWMWLVGILCTAAIAAAKIAWTGAERVSKVEYSIDRLQDADVYFDMRVKRLESISVDLDSIKAWTRPNRR